VAGGKAVSVVDKYIEIKIMAYKEEIELLRKQNALLKKEIYDLKAKGVKD